MKPVIELRSDMRVKTRYGLWFARVFTAGAMFVSGLWIGQGLVKSTELNKQESFAVGVDVYDECRRTFGEKAAGKCQYLAYVAYRSGWKERGKK